MKKVNSLMVILLICALLVGNYSLFISNSNQDDLRIGMFTPNSEDPPPIQN